MILFVHFVLYALAIFAAWLVLALAPALLLGRGIHLADEIELGVGGDEGEGVFDFVPPPHDIGKSIATMTGTDNE